MTPSSSKIIELIEFTDPVCTWCWGSEPVLRKLETSFGEQVKISYIMGGLVQDSTSFYDSYNDIGGDPDRSNKNIAKHWVNASARHGMPVKSEGFKLFSREHPSTYPQIQMTFDLTHDELKTIIDSLLDKQLIRKREAGNGYFISPKVSAMACDSTGVCAG